MDRYADIYAHHAEQYDQLIVREDYEGNLARALHEIIPWAGLDVIDMGCGTGRLVRLLAPLARSVKGFDLSAAMLAEAETRLKGTDLHNWELRIADHGALPAPDAAADLTISGWSIVYAAMRSVDWRASLRQALSEMRRVTRHGGMQVIIETLGTGFTLPTPPPTMHEYLTYLNDEAGFASVWVRTDYAFASPEEAATLTEFFFGEDMSDRLLSRDPAILPECTGIWWKRANG